MSVYINTNTMSLTAQRALSNAQDMQATAMERLSTGKRINSAADDSAGLAIAEKFTAQINGLNQAVKNASAADNLAQTAESALVEITDIVQRMRELTVQASNSTLSASDRSAIKSELNTLTSEIDRIVNDTHYNGISLLDGTAKLSFQIGTEASSKMQLNIASSTSSALGLGSGAGGSVDATVVGGIVSTVATTALGADDLLINGQNWWSGDQTPIHEYEGQQFTRPQNLDFDGTSAARELAMAINTNTHLHGVTAGARTVFEGQKAGGVTDGTVTLTIASFDGSADLAHEIGPTSNMQELAAEISSKDSFVTATVKADGGLRIVDDLGRQLTFANSSTATTGFSASESRQGFLYLTSNDGSAITLAAGPDADGNSDTDDIANMGLRVGTYGSGENGTTHTLVGEHIVNTTSITGVHDLTVNGVQIGRTDPLVADDEIQASDLAAAVNSVAQQSGVTATASNELFLFAATGTTLGTSAVGANGFVLNGATIGSAGANGTFATLAAEINTDMAAIGSDIRAEVYDNTRGVIKLTSASGASIELTDHADNNIKAVERADGSNLIDTKASSLSDIATTKTTFTGKLTFTSETGPITFGMANYAASIDVADTLANGGGDAVADLFGVVITGDPSSASSSGGSTSGINVSSASAAASSIASIDAALAKVSASRADLGAMSNRLAHTVSNLQTISEQHSESRAAIQDADYAVESAALARAQVLAQAGTAMLAQANAAPQLALQLLQ